MKLRRKTLGLILLAVPIPTLILTLSLYAILNFIASSLADTGNDAGGLMVVAQFSNIALGLLGIVSVVGIIIGMPVGLILLLSGGSSPTTRDSGAKH